MLLSKESYAFERSQVLVLSASDCETPDSYKVSQLLFPTLALFNHHRQTLFPKLMSRSILLQLSGTATPLVLEPFANIRLTGSVSSRGNPSKPAEF